MRGGVPPSRSAAAAHRPWAGDAGDLGHGAVREARRGDPAARRGSPSAQYSGVGKWGVPALRVISAAWVINLCWQSTQVLKQA
eukprot:gene25653-biopygen21008